MLSWIPFSDLTNTLLRGSIVVRHLVFLPQYLPHLDIHHSQGSMFICHNSLEKRLVQGLAAFGLWLVVKACDDDTPGVVY